MAKRTEYELLHSHGALHRSRILAVHSDRLRRRGNGGFADLDAGGPVSGEAVSRVGPAVEDVLMGAMGKVLG